MDDDILTIEEVARYLRVSERRKQVLQGAERAWFHR